VVPATPLSRLAWESKVSGDMNNNNNTSVPSISSALIAASEHILHFSEAESPQERNAHLSDAIIAGRCAARYFVICKIDAAYHEYCLSQQEAEDIAQEAALKIFSTPMLHRCESIIQDAYKNGAKVSGDNTDLKGFLHRVIECRTIDALRSHNRALRDLATKREIDTDVERAHSELPLCQLGKGTQRKLEVSSRCKRVMELHDQFLSMKKYKGVRLSILLAAHGDWTPAKEWSGVMTLEDRPKTIPPRTVQRIMEQARSYVRKHMKDDLNGPSL